MRFNKGFTLFELLVSISIIGILMAIASVAYSNSQKKGRDARRMQDLKNIQSASEVYYSSNNYVYPMSTSVAWTGPGGSLIMAKFPTDPKGTSYTYSKVSSGALDGTNYCACATMEDTSLHNSGLNCNNYGTGTAAYCVRSQQ